MKKVFALVLSLSFLGTSASAVADVPTEMNIQGRLTNGAGAPAPIGLKIFTFKIYDQQVGGVEIWPVAPGESQTLSTDANGLWNAGVGALIPLTEVVFLSPVRWLEITVNDGMNPIETLSRIELRTTPYTYRSASSQQADSLGGLSLSDLVDQFVDESGDTMTGRLSVDWIHHNLGSSISVDNHNDLWTPYWNDEFVGTWGLAVDVNGDNNNFNVGVAAAARGDNGVVDGNYGVLSIADGNTANFGVFASTGLGGTSNYSGYFSQGDFVIDIPATPGTAGVILPPNAIDNSEILDEPGLAAAQSTTFTALSCAVSSNLISVSITIPGPGYIQVDARCNATSSSSTGGGLIGGAVAIDESSGGPISAPYAASWEQQLPSGGFHFIDFPVSTYRIYYKAVAGTYTFHLNGTKFGNCPAGFTASVSSCMIRANYFSTSYGTVATLVNAQEAGQFDKSEPVLVSNGPGEDAPQITLYQVDLRELELRAARTQAEAEKARRELVEARQGMTRSAGGGVTRGEQR